MPDEAVPFEMERRPSTADPDPCADHIHVDVPFAGADPLTWRVASEIVRRHPKDLWVLRTFPFDGHYDCLSIRRLPEPLASHGAISINRNGTHVKVGLLAGNAAVTNAEATTEEPLVSWGNAYADPDPRDWIREVERLAGLSRPGAVPPSTPSSLAVRWIASFLSMQLESRPRWSAWNDWREVDSGEHAADFDAIEGLRDWKEEHGGTAAAALAVFVGTFDGSARSPRLVLTVDGQLWRADSAPMDLAATYADVGRNISRLVASTASDHLP